MRRADRLFRLVQLLRARRFATGEQIADELGVSKRTVYRDVADLQGSGVPIRGEAGVGYRLERGYELAPLDLHERRARGPRARRAHRGRLGRRGARVRGRRAR